MLITAITKYIFYSVANIFTPLTDTIMRKNNNRLFCRKGFQWKILNEHPPERNGGDVPLCLFLDVSDEKEIWCRLGNITLESRSIYPLLRRRPYS